jgi:hypothetical protein
VVITITIMVITKNKNITSKDTKQMIRSMIASSKDNDSDSDSVDTIWRADLLNAEQMHVLAAAGICPDDKDIEFNTDDLKKYKKQAKKWSKSNKKKIKRRWDDAVVPPSRKVARSTTPILVAGRIKTMKNPAQIFSEVIVSIVGTDGTETMARCLLDTSCTKSMILKKFTEIKRRNKLSKEDTIEYKTYGKSSMSASVGFKMVEFQRHQNHSSNK